MKKIFVYEEKDNNKSIYYTVVDRVRSSGNLPDRDGVLLRSPTKKIRKNTY